MATFSSLEEIARDRVGRIASDAQIREAFRRAEREGRFRVSEVSPVAAAARIRVPVLVLHGAGDTETSPAHSRRVYASLAVPKQIEVVPGAGHDDALGRGWARVERWLEASISAPGAAGGRRMAGCPSSPNSSSSSWARSSSRSSGS